MEINIKLEHNEAISAIEAGTLLTFIKSVSGGSPAPQQPQVAPTPVVVPVQQITPVPMPQQQQQQQVAPVPVYMGMDFSSGPDMTAYPTPTPVQQAAYTAPVTTQLPIQQTTPAPVQQTTLQQQQVIPTHTGVPTCAPTYTIDQIQRAAGQYAQLGNDQRMMVLGLIQSFGFNAITDMEARPDAIGAFATKLRELGAQI